jgi:hypothetical protein
MNDHLLSDGSDHVHQYINELLDGLSEIACQAGLRRLAGDLEELRQRHVLASNLAYRTAMISKQAASGG